MKDCEISDILKTINNLTYMLWEIQRNYLQMKSNSF